MLPRLSLLIALLFTASSLSAQFCSSAGNVVIFANYDGGVLNIVVDQNIPNLKIGVCTYEAVAINISGPYAGNVSAVHYAGFNANNDHCNDLVTTTTITGVSTSITEILFAPPATLDDALGYGSIICAYSCDTDWQGGCNTATQIADYFVDDFNGEMLMYYTQYGCWLNQPIPISGGETCCPGMDVNVPMADFVISDSQICQGECVSFIDLTTNGPTEWDWIFPGAQINTSGDQNPSGICFDEPGSYGISLTSGNFYGNTVAIHYITVEACAVPGCTYPAALNYNPSATIDDQSCVFDCDQSTPCEGDFNQDGFVSVGDLLYFIGLYGGICPP